MLASSDYSYRPGVLTSRVHAVLKSDSGALLHLLSPERIVSTRNVAEHLLYTRSYQSRSQMACHELDSVHGESKLHAASVRRGLYGERLQEKYPVTISGVRLIRHCLARED